MSLDLDALRIGLRTALGMDLVDLPNTTVPDTATDAGKIGADVLLNMSYWELLDKFPFREKEKSSTFTTTIGERLYKIPTLFEALRQLSVEGLKDKKHTTLDRMTIFEYENLYANLTSANGKPERYLREKDGIKLHPTPDQCYVITIKYWTTLNDFSDSKKDPEIPQSWHEIILLGAIARGYELVQGDYERGAAATFKQASLIKSITPVEEKEETDTHHGGVEVLGYDVI